MSNATPLEKIMQMSLDDYIKLSKGKINSEKTQPRYNSASMDVGHKRFFHDEDADIDDDLQLNDDEENELLKCDDFDDDDIVLEDKEIKIEKFVQPSVPNKPTNTGVNNQNVKKLPALMDLKLTGKTVNQGPLACRMRALKQKQKQKQKQTQKPVQQNPKNFPKVNQQSKGDKNKNNRCGKKKFYQKRKKFQQYNYRYAQQKPANRQSIPKPMNLENRSNLYITIGNKSGAPTKTVQLQQPEYKMGSSSSSLLASSWVNRNSQSLVSQRESPAGQDIRSALGLSNVTLTKPTEFAAVANMLLKLFNNSPRETMHKPIYDMKVQKEIHNLQHKPLMYNQEATVISSDGPGINNLRFTPSTSGITLNCRFSR